MTERLREIYVDLSDGGMYLLPSGVIARQRVGRMAAR